jgi:hypothetical protein
MYNNKLHLAVKCGYLLFYIVVAKYSKMDKGAKDKLVRSPGENGGG